MNLHALVSSLLPHEYREQVLGDLHERGFRLRDIANVLPRVWASHFVRTLAGPTPQQGVASVQALIVRTQHLADQRRLVSVLVIGLALLARSYPFPIGLGSRAALMLGLVLLAVALAYVGGGYRSGPDTPLSLDFSRAKRLAEYRQQIHQQQTMFKLLPLLLFVMANPVALARASLPAFTAFCVAAVLLFGWTRLRRKQLQREIESLE